MKNSLLLFASILFTLNISAQLQPTFLGSSYSSGGDCYVITSDVQTQLGAVWYQNQIDFNSDFEIIFDANFGSNDELGADGMALVMKNNPNLQVGQVGGGLAYQGIMASIAIEFDTYQNSERGDPSEDHIALISNGSTDHAASTNLAGPVSALSTSPNIEDNQFHEVKISWEASTQTFKVIFDCEERISYTGDLVNNAFNGESGIYFGFTGSTGLYHNLQQLCFKYISFADSQDLLDQEICSGESLDTVDIIYNGAVAYQWSPATGVSDVTLPNPVFSPDTSTTYTVDITDSCGEIVSKSFNLQVNQVSIDSVTPTNTTICPGEDAEFIITGTSNAEVTYTINGGTEETVLMDNSGNASVLIPNPTADQTINITFIDDISNTGCSMSLMESSTVFVDQGSGVTLTYTATCDGGIASVEGDDGGTFIFNPEPGDGAVIDSDTGLITNGLPSTTYTVDYTTSGLCLNTITQSVTTLEISDPSFVLTPTLCGATATVIGDQGGTFSFSVPPSDSTEIDESTGEIINGTSGVTYYISYTTAGSCPQTETNSITIHNCKIPQAISPNNDSLNDTFDLTGFNVRTLKIYNRYGRLVYDKHNGYDNEFEGISNNGDELPTGTYYYSILFQDNTTEVSWLYINK